MEPIASVEKATAEPAVVSRRSYSEAIGRLCGLLIGGYSGCRTRLAYHSRGPGKERVTGRTIPLFVGIVFTNAIDGMQR
jgi:hypothetical protein